MSESGRNGPLGPSPLELLSLAISGGGYGVRMKRTPPPPKDTDDHAQLTACVGPRKSRPEVIGGGAPHRVNKRDRGVSIWFLDTKVIPPPPVKKAGTNDTCPSSNVCFVKWIVKRTPSAGEKVFTISLAIKFLFSLILKHFWPELLQACFDTGMCSVQTF